MSNKTTPEFYRKNIQIKSKWFDDIIKDNKFYGVGTVNNQIHYPNGAKDEAPNLDRSFAYEFKENEIYAYGLLDGYNGTWAVDIVEQCILTNMYFDYLFSLQKMSDEQILEVLNEEFQKAETTLQDNQQDFLLERASLAIEEADLRKGTLEYVSILKKKKSLDKQLNSGLFAMIALVVDKRLFVSNIGTSHCFILRYDERTNEKHVVSVETEHKVKNYLELIRLKRLNANMVDPEQYTRCLGDFKLKLYYYEDPQFKDCTGPPIICKPSYPLYSINIDDSFLFMVMYTDGLARAIEETDLKGENTDAKIAKVLCEKIMNEPSLNSAAQAVLDEIKRAYDDKFVSKYSEREDMTLIVRVFNSNTKSRLSDIEKLGNQLHNASNSTINNSIFQSTMGFLETDGENSDLDDLEDDDVLSTIRMNSWDSRDTSNGSIVGAKKSISDFLDENNCVIPYIDLRSEYDKMMLDEANWSVFREFETHLSGLENLNLGGEKGKHELEAVKEETS